mmetsp:Transcript_41341/g.92462  ORF Transcript_41341/g.92462 Transcript_41341/m.92462 type:complete len:215 (-) Transcript_41341:33-677(-)
MRANGLGNLDGDPTGCCCATQHQELVTCSQRSKLGPGEVPSGARKQGLVGREPGERKANQLGGRKAPALGHGIRKGNCVLGEGSSWTGGRVVAASLAKANVDANFIPDCQVSDALANLRDHSGHVKARHVREGHRANAVEAAAEQLPVDGIHSSQLHLDENLALLRFRHGHRVERHLVDGVARISCLTIGVHTPGLHLSWHLHVNCGGGAGVSL